jgi:hypothetical protein
VKKMHGNLHGAETGEDDDAAVSCAQTVITDSEDNDECW